LARDIFLALDLPPSQEDKQHPDYYSAYIIEPGHYPTPTEEEIDTCQLYLAVKAKTNDALIKLAFYSIIP
jgi:hypothetical protein